MGYESRLYIGNRREADSTFKNRLGVNAWFSEIATYDLCKMGNCSEFYAVFDKDIDFNVSADGEDTNVDCYGKICRYADIDEVIKVLELYTRKCEHYRRVQPLLSMLKGFDKAEWDELVVVHYGY